MRNLLAVLCCSALVAGAAACQPVPAPDGERGETVQTDGGETPAFDRIGEDEMISLVGTEPFWGGTVARGRFLYRTIDDQVGQDIAVRRFAGNNGLGFSGTFNGLPVDIAITPGECSDGMSDRSFPFVATLRIGPEQRSGCAWTERKPFKTAGNETKRGD